MSSLAALIDAAITEELAAIIAENEALRTLPGEVLSQFLHWLIHRDVTVTVGRGVGADALAKPMVAFLNVNGLPKGNPEAPKLKTPGRIQA
jgi:hypothetical protein